MASQYVTYLLIFVVGLMLVIFSDSILYTITDDFKDSMAYPELEKTVVSIRNQIISGISEVQQNPETRITYNLNLPQQLAKKYTYNIMVNMSTDGFYRLKGITTQQVGEKLEVLTSLGLHESSIKIQGIIRSTDIQPKITMQYVDNQIEVSLQ